MSRPALTMQQLPPIELPMGYFLTGPWFGIAAGVFLAYSGPTAWATRWAPSTLGATHLLVLGCMVMIMMGALVQIMPVISAAAVPGARRFAPLIRWSLGIGAGALAFALAKEYRPAYVIAGSALALAFGLYLAPLCSCLVRRIGGGDSMFGIRIAVLCLLSTVGLGIMLLVGRLFPELVPSFRAWTSVHVGFGLTGWVALLIMAVSFQIIPMFHVAPDYPRWLARSLPIAMVTGIVLGPTWDIGSWIIGSCCLLYAAATLLLLGRRKRRAPDVTVWFWQLAMTVLIAGVICWWIAPQAEFLVGVLFLFGFALTVMIGMLYKIVAFLVFTHLQRACLHDPSRIVNLPRMDRIIPVQRARRQLALHAATLLACIAAVLAPPLGVVAAVLITVNFAWLFASIWIGHRCYHRVALAWAVADGAEVTTPQLLGASLLPTPIVTR